MTENSTFKPVKEWSIGRLQLKILWVRDHFCGYVTFPKRPFKQQGYDGFLNYVPVHGGITYAQQEKNGSMTYGFDCAHSGDYVEYSFRTPYTQQGHKWTLEEVTAETNKLAKNLLIAVKYEKLYNACDSMSKIRLRKIGNGCKADIIDKYHKELGEKFDITDNFGASINLLAGRL